jgi:membrane associated rhomboid family serine protease
MLQLRSATAIIAIVTVAVSAIILIFLNLGVAATYWGFTPALVGVDLTSSLAIPWWLTPWSSALIHGGWLHLFVNMLILVFAGSQVERVIGGSGLLLAYLVGALAAAAAQYLAGPNSIVPMVGASGAISALFALYALFFGRPKQVTSNQKLNRSIHVAWLATTWVVLQWMAGVLAGGQGVMLATPAHIGGFIAGLLLQRPLLLLRYRKA